MYIWYMYIATCQVSHWRTEQRKRRDITGVIRRTIWRSCSRQWLSQKILWRHCISVEPGLLKLRVCVNSWGNSCYCWEAGCGWRAFRSFDIPLTNQLFSIVQVEYRNWANWSSACLRASVPCRWWQGHRPHSQACMPNLWNNCLLRTGKRQNQSHAPKQCWTHMPPGELVRDDTATLLDLRSYIYIYICIYIYMYDIIYIDYVVYHFLRYRAERVVLENIDWLVLNRSVLGQMGPHETCSTWSEESQCWDIKINDLRIL